MAGADDKNSAEIFINRVGRMEPQAPVGMVRAYGPYSICSPKLNVRYPLPMVI